MEGPASEEAERRAEELERGIVHEEPAPAAAPQMIPSRTSSAG